jgi:hypothetical protein
MSRPAILMALWMALAAPAFAQIAAPGGSPPAWTFRTNFAIPDAPAFELLEVDPSTILRPQATRAFALDLSKFQGTDGSFAIPRAIALEFSPALLLEGDRLGDNRTVRHPGLYNLRLSLAALRDQTTGQSVQLAGGLRMTIADGTRVKNDKDYPLDLQITPLTDQAVVIYSDATKAERVHGPIVLPKEQQEQMDALAKEVRERWAKRYWNVARLEAAVGLLGTAADSTGRDIRLDQVSLWLSGSLGIQGWGQLLVGFRGGSSRDSLSGDYSQLSSFAARLYAGGAETKAYVELQQTMREGSKAQFAGGTGLELTVSDWLWLNFSGGFEREDGHTHTSTGFKLKTAIPGL